MAKVSIIIPAYNKAALTVETINSVLAQTYNDIEIIVVDDGSSDDTRYRLELFGDKIKCIYKENGGACSARNVGIKAASGEYIGLLDCDDIYHPQKVALAVEYLNSNLDCGFIYTQIYFIDQDSRVILNHKTASVGKQGWIRKALFFDNFVRNSTVMVRKKCFDEVGLFDESIFMPADWDMWLRLADKFKAGFIDEALTSYRVTDSYIMAHLFESEEQEYYVLNKTLDNGGGLWEIFFRRKVFANLYMRFAKMLAVKANMQSAKLRFRWAFLKYPFDLKIVAFFIWSLIFPGLLQSWLEKKVPFKA